MVHRRGSVQMEKRERTGPRESAGVPDVETTPMAPLSLLLFGRRPCPSPRAVRNVFSELASDGRDSDRASSPNEKCWIPT